MPDGVEFGTVSIPADTGGCVAFIAGAIMGVGAVVVVVVPLSAVGKGGGAETDARSDEENAYHIT